MAHGRHGNVQLVLQMFDLLDHRFDGRLGITVVAGQDIVGNVDIFFRAHGPVLLLKSQISPDMLTV